MSDIHSAKRSLGRELRALDGFVGIGVDGRRLRLYATAETAPVVKRLRQRWGATYRGFPVSVIVSQGFKAQAQGA